MVYKRVCRNCPISSCRAKYLIVRLANHLADLHQLDHIRHTRFDNFNERWKHFIKKLIQLDLWLTWAPCGRRTAYRIFALRLSCLRFCISLNFFIRCHRLLQRLERLRILYQRDVYHQQQSECWKQSSDVIVKHDPLHCQQVIPLNLYRQYLHDQNPQQQGIFVGHFKFRFFSSPFKFQQLGKSFRLGTQQRYFFFAFLLGYF